MKITKSYITPNYMIAFDKNTGVEILSGINGHEDPFRLIYPSLMDIGIMGHCQNKCSFCYQGDDYQPNMKLSDFQILIDQSKDFVNQVALGGRGDPNQHENFKEILDYCVANNVVPNYTTSGKNLTDEQIEISKSCGVVAVSAYNQDFTYDSIERLMDNSIKTNIHFVVTSETIHDAIKLVKGEDVFNGKVDFTRLNAVVFLLFKPQGKGITRKDLIPSKEDLSELVEIIGNPSCAFKIGMDSCLFNKISHTRPLSETEKICGDSCEAGRMSCYVSADMKLLPCSFCNHIEWGQSIINVYDVKNIWDNGLAFEHVRTKLKERPDSCPYNL